MRGNTHRPTPQARAPDMGEQPQLLAGQSTSTEHGNPVRLTRALWGCLTVAVFEMSYLFRGPEERQHNCASLSPRPKSATDVCGVNRAG